MLVHPSQQPSTMKAEQQYLKGQTLLRKRKPKEAIPFLEEAIKLNPAHKEAQDALQNALESLKWNTTYFCRDCGAFIKPERKYPEIKFDGVCPRCFSTIPTKLEKGIGFAELIIKTVFFGLFLVVTLFFCIFPVYVIKWGGAYLELASILSAIYIGMSLTPLFVLLFLAFDPGGNLSRDALYWLFNFLEPLDRVHPVLFFTAEILILFVVVYLSFLFILTPIFYIHKKGYWKNKRHQKTVILLTSIYVALVVLRRVSAGVFE